MALRFSAVMLSLLPSLTLAAGIALVEAAGVFTSVPNLALVLAMLVAVVSPLLALGALKVVEPNFDRALISIVGMTVAIGTATLYALSKTEGAAGLFYTTIAIRHGMFVGIGFVALVAGAIVSKRIDGVARYPVSVLGLALLMTVGTVLFGQAVNGARLWLQIGPVRVQPSEFARVLIAAFVAIYLYERRHLVAAPWGVGSPSLLPSPYVLPMVGALAGAAGVLVFQNDLGMAALVVLGAFASTVAVMTSRATLAFAGAILCGAVVASFLTVSRVSDRVIGWLNAWDDPADRGFQFVQAEYGLASGGMVGDSRQTAASFVPEIHTDLILVAVGNQFGWLGATALVVLIGLLVCRCVLVALRSTDGFRTLLAMSLSALLGIQIVLIVGGTLRIVPLTGLTVPLVSYGGSSMVVTMFAVGVIVGVGASAGRRG